MGLVAEDHVPLTEDEMLWQIRGLLSFCTSESTISTDQAVAVNLGGGSGPFCKIDTPIRELAEWAKKGILAERMKRERPDGPEEHAFELKEALESVISEVSWFVARRKNLAELVDGTERTWSDALNDDLDIGRRALKNAAPQGNKANTPYVEGNQAPIGNRRALPNNPAESASEAGAERDPNDPDPVEHARELAAALIEARKELVEIRPDAARYRWPRGRTFGADFEHSSIEQGAGWALIFFMPTEGGST